MGDDQLWNALGAIGEIVGAIAVLATLGYLSVQIRMSTKTQRAQTHQQIADARRENLTMLLEIPGLDDAVRKAHSGEEMSVKDKRLLRQFTVIVARHHENELYQHSVGMIDDDELEAQRKIMQFPHIRLEEIENSIELYTPRMREEMRRLLALRKAAC